MTDTPELHDALEDAMQMSRAVDAALRDSDSSSVSMAAKTGAINGIPGVRTRAFDDAITITRRVRDEADTCDIAPVDRGLWKAAWVTACELIIRRLANQMANDEEAEQ